MFGNARDLGWCTRSSGVAETRLEPPLGERWKVKIDCNYDDLLPPLFGDSVVYTTTDYREDGKGDRLISFSESGVIDYGYHNAQSLNVFDSFLCFTQDHSESIIIEVTSGEAVKVPDVRVQGVWATADGDPVVEFRSGRFNCGTGAYEETPWRQGCMGSIVDRVYYGEWWGEDGQKAHGCRDCETLEVPWQLKGVLGATVVTSTHLLAVTTDGPLVVDRESGEACAAPPSWRSAASLVRQDSWIASRNDVREFPSGEMVAEFPNSAGPITLTEGLAWVTERIGGRYDSSHAHCLVCYDLEARREVWRQSIGKTGGSVMAHYGFSNGQVFRLRKNSLECWGV